jgi:hypothetical protein
MKEDTTDSLCAAAAAEAPATFGRTASMNKMKMADAGYEMTDAQRTMGSW